MATSITERMTAATTGALQGKVAIITGAGRGVGQAIALGYANAGAAVCCLSLVADEVDETVGLIKGAGGLALAATVDVQYLDQVEAAVEATVRTFGGVDILVANHGANLTMGPVEDTDAAKWRETVLINLIGTYQCARAVIPHLKVRGAGKIIAVGSGQGHRGSAGQTAYATSKAGIWMLVQTLAEELAPFNISVNELLPGHVNTAMYKESTKKLAGAKAPGDGQRPSHLRPNEWLKQPKDVVPLALFLACQPDVGPTAQSFSLMRRF